MFPVADCHADTLMKRYLMKHGLELTEATGGVRVTPENMRKGNVVLQVFSVFVPDAFRDQALRSAMEMITDADILRREYGLRWVLAPSDLDDLESGILLSLEGALPLGADASLLPLFHRLGVRMITLAWSRVNPFCDGVGSERGLSEAGVRLVKECEELGIIVDVSHASGATFRDVMELVKRPPIASHSCCAVLNPHPRNLTDSQMKALADHDGMMCINIFPLFLTGSREATLADVVAHVKHACDIMGPERVGIGSDLDGIPHGPVGLFDPSGFPALEEALIHGGLDRGTVRGVMGANLLSFLAENLPGAQNGYIP